MPKETPNNGELPLMQENSPLVRAIVMVLALMGGDAKAYKMGGDPSDSQFEALTRQGLDSGQLPSQRQYEQAVGCCQTHTEDPHCRVILDSVRGTSGSIHDEVYGGSAVHRRR